MHINAKSFLFVLMLLHLAIVLPLAFYLNVWMDEASTLYTTQHGFFFAIQNAAADEKQAPLYFWLMGLWREINHSIFFARLFSIAASLCAIKFFFDLAGKFFTEKQAGFAAAFFALHPVLIWMSLEIRVYSTVVLLSVLLLKFFCEGYLEESETKTSPDKARIFYVLTAIIALYTNYYLGFILAGNFFALLVLKRFQALKIYVMQMLIAGFCSLPLLWLIKQQFAANTGGFRPEIPVLEGFQRLWGYILSFILPTELFPGKDTTEISIIRNWIVRIGLLLTIIFLVRSWRRGFENREKIFGAISAVVGAFLFAGYLLSGREYFELRHTSPLFVPFVLLAASLFFRLVPQKFYAMIALMFAVLFSYSLYHQYSPLAKRGDWYRVAKFIETHEKPNQPIIVFRNFDALSLPPHYRGINKILPDKKFFDWSSEDSFLSENAWKNQTEFIISQIPADASEIWLATEEFCQIEESAPACRPLENFVEENFTVALTQDFYKERLRLLQRKR
jgi:hypothetical protein